MSSAAGAAPNGANPWAVSSLVHEHLVALAGRFDDVAERLAGLAARCAASDLVGTDWTGPGSRAFRARVERHESDLREDAERCRGAARSIRWGAAALADRIAAAESVAELGGPVLAVLGAALGPVPGPSGAPSPHVFAAVGAPGDARQGRTGRADPGCAGLQVQGARGGVGGRVPAGWVS